MRKKNLEKKVLTCVCVVTLMFAGMTPVSVVRADGDEGGTATEVNAPADCMEKVYECLTKEGSSYNEMKEMYIDYETGEYTMSFQESFDSANNQIVISSEAVNKEDESYEYLKDAEGTWTFGLDGNYLTLQTKQDDIMGIYSIFKYGIYDAVIECLGLDPDLANGFSNAVEVGRVTSDYYIVDFDSDNSTVSFKLYLAGQWDLENALGDVCLDEEFLQSMDTDALSENYQSMNYNMGKLTGFVSGNKDSVDIIIGEFSNRTNLTYKSLCSLVTVLMPEGYADFLENYKSLAEVKTAGYQVSFPVKEEDLPDIFANETWMNKYKFTKVHFGETEDTYDETETPSTSTDATDKSVTTPSVSFREGTGISLKAGKSRTLTVENGTVTKWTSSNKKVATVKDGKVTALKKGTTVIKATLADGNSLTCKVKVTSDPVIKVAGKKFKASKTYTIKKNKILKVKITGKASGIKNNYTSSKKKVAKVTSQKTANTVKIKGLKKGKVKIGITVNGVKFTIKLKVK